MEQLYLIEIMIDKVTIFASEHENSADKHLILKVKFGPEVEFLIKEGQMSPRKGGSEDLLEYDEAIGKKKWSRTIRVGKSYLFPSYPDTVMKTLSKFPLEIEVWNDDETEIEIFVGVGSMIWDTEFYHMLRDTAIPCKTIEPLTIKQKIALYAECCCAQNGEITFILRLTALGDSIITEFQQLMEDPETFVFRTNKAPSMFKCNRVDGDDPNFTMVGTLYETTTLEDPDICKGANDVIEVCTDLDSCGITPLEPYTCKHTTKQEIKKRKFPIKKIKMGDITGPCGNANCALAHKVRTYIRNLETYKKAAAVAAAERGNEPRGLPGQTTKKTCGSCICKDDTWHRDSCPEKTGKENKVVCNGCGGMTQSGLTCDEKKQSMFGTGATPKPSVNSVAPPKDKVVQYCFSTNNVAMFENTTTYMEMLEKSLRRCVSMDSSLNDFFELSESASSSSDCNGKAQYQLNVSQSLLDMASFRCDACKQNYSSKEILNDLINLDPQHPKPNTYQVYNCTVTPDKLYHKNPIKNTYQVYNCTTISEDKACRCSPKRDMPTCGTFNCECLEKSEAIDIRKRHKPFCPAYRHKPNCPVLVSEEEDTDSENKDEPEPLPYGLPPVHLGPCPVLGRPCSVPDGFTRMYKIGALPPGPPSYSNAGKVCCSKEYERIKKAIADYMKYEKGPDFRCINRFNVDTERRCCDKDQRLMQLMGKGCCGSHKLAIRDAFNKNHGPSTGERK